MIVPTVTPPLAMRLLESLRAAAGSFETIVVDNGTGSEELARATAALPGGELVSVASNLGFGRASNLAARSAQGRAIVLLNDDSVVEPGFVELITAPLNPEQGVVMSAGVMLDGSKPELIETAGIELDATLFAFDYLNGEPISVLEGNVVDPIGPSGAAAAFATPAFLDVGGFDENLFAYLEDVDLVLRLRCSGGVCRLAPGARGRHEHSATLGSGSPEKNYLMGFGRGYMLRKWGVLRPRRVPSVLARELAVVTGQAVVDRNLAGARGRLRGIRAAAPSERYPGSEILARPPSFVSTVRRRWRRRARLRRKPE